MTASEIRTSFLRFFEQRNHRIVPSASLVPVDDPTLLFTNAGMNQFKDVFLGQERRDYARATSAQKCMRVSGKHNDLDNVGPSLRHHTFFEMLGNFSFGDYFKPEAIAFAWELLTREWGLPGDHLVATVFGGEAGIPRDEEAYREWQRFLPDDRIGELGISENFWSMGDRGPCGRCSEVHYFRGDHLPCARTPCLGVSCDCDRFVEIWNNVFMEFDRGADQALTPLPAPSIDTGMGLERIAAVVQGTLSNYQTDLFQPLLEGIGHMAGRVYGHAPAVSDTTSPDVSIRVVADHLRAMTFLIADGVMPSNEWRGYVLRKIMRRAMRHGKRLGMAEPFLYRLVDVVIQQMAHAYPELPRTRDTIVGVVRSEEERFDAVLTDGLPRLEGVLAAAAAEDQPVGGQEAFRLYDTYGLPIDYIEDLASEHGLAIDRRGFDAALEGQRARARAGQSFESGQPRRFGYASTETESTVTALGDRFEGYGSVRENGVPIVAIFGDDRQQRSSLHADEAGYVVLERTPFYVESGGQVSDEGWIVSDAGEAEASVIGVVRLGPGVPRAHHVKVTRGTLRERDIVTAEVDAGRRDATRRNHTATHLLHAALRQVLGGHVKQAGSLVAPDRLRFDFVHFAALPQDKIDQIERVVSERIHDDTTVETEVRSTQEAIAAGAMALFGEKYGDTVRVVSVPGVSLELCGGTHCRATGEIGTFVIVQEGGVAAGVRRIEALTGEAAVRYVQQRRAALRGILDAIGVPEDQAPPAIERLQADAKRLRRELSALQIRAAMGQGSETTDEVTRVAGVDLVARRVSGLDRAALRELSDSLKSRLTAGVVVLASDTDGRVAVVVSVTRNLVDRVHAGRLVRALAPIVGGGGGGRADFAEAGGKHPDRIGELLDASRHHLAGELGAAPDRTPPRDTGC